MITAKARFRAARKLERVLGYRIPDKVFHGAFLEAVTASLGFERLDRGVKAQLLEIFRDFLKCKCRESPLCGCPERKFVAHLIELREAGLDHRQISSHLLEVYGIDLYPADILGFLEDSVHLLEALRDVARLDGRETVMERVEEHIRRIEQ